MTKHDVWYFTVETTIAGELRGFSRQIKAREDRRNPIPTIVRQTCETFLADCLAGSDVHTYDAVARGERLDWPYRFASYHLTRNGVDVVRSFAVKPVKPDVLV
jgi:hypothetical protein